MTTLNKSKIELLAPAGKLENAYAAIENGADALYVGGKLFNARQYANNFTNEMLQELVKYCKLRGVKVYITLNILIKQDEVIEVFNYLDYLSSLSIDGIIIQDVGVARIVKEYFPHIPLHASTQMTIHSINDVKFIEEYGFSRVVLARELTLKDIAEIRKTSEIELETFVHGALCYSFSGQCLLSSFIGGRSGNRGQCAQPCRMGYSLFENKKNVVSNKCLLSLKDMNTISILPDLIECGIASFKIEGRMRSPEYVASVTRIYRKYIDLYLNHSSHYKVDDSDIEELLTLFNRGDFTKGYYFEKPGIHMITPHSPKNTGLEIGKVINYNPKTKLATILTGKKLNPGDGIEIIDSHLVSEGTGISKTYESGSTLKIKLDKIKEINSKVYLSKNHELLKKLQRSYNKSQRKLPIKMSIIGEMGKPLIITINYKDISIKEVGDTLENAVSAPITKENALNQLTKLGNTSFCIEEVKIVWEDNLYLPIVKLNEARRNIIKKLEYELTKPSYITHKKVYQPPKFNPINKRIFRCKVSTLEQLEKCAQHDEIKGIYWEWNYSNDLSQLAHDLCKKYNKEFYLALPYILENDLWTYYQEKLLYWENTDIDGYLIRNYGSFYFLKNSRKSKQIDYPLNVLNSESIKFWYEHGASGISISVEATDKDLLGLNTNIEKIIYGHIPMMTTKQCLLGHYNRCKNKDNNNYNKLFHIQDRKNVKWLLDTDCNACIMQILSDKPVYIRNINELSNTRIHSFRLNFTIESKEETKKILDSYF